MKYIEESIKQALSYIKDVDGCGCKDEDCLNIATNSLRRALQRIAELKEMDVEGGKKNK